MEKSKTIGILFMAIMISLSFTTMPTMATSNPSASAPALNSTLRIYGDVPPQGNAPERYTDWRQPFDPTVIPKDSITFNPAIIEGVGQAQQEDADVKTYLRMWFEPCHEYHGNLGRQKYPAMEVEYTYMIIDNKHKMPWHANVSDVFGPFLPIVEIANQTGLGDYENNISVDRIANPNKVHLKNISGTVPDSYNKTVNGTIVIEKIYYLAPGETVQFLDHKLRYESTDVTGNTAYCHLWYAGNVEDDAAKMIELPGGQTFFFDRWNNMLNSSSHPDATWYAHFEFKLQNGWIAIVVGKELSTGDTFYVNGVRYDVPSIEVLDMNGDMKADVFKFITLRTPLPKSIRIGVPFVRDETVVTSQWLDCIAPNETIPVLPPFNMNHSIVDDINVPLWAPLKHLEKWPEGDPWGVAGFEYFPCAESYLTQQCPPPAWQKYFAVQPICAQEITDPQLYDNYWNTKWPYCAERRPGPTWIAWNVVKRIIDGVAPLNMSYRAEAQEERYSTNLLEKLNETGSKSAIIENWSKFDIQTLPDQYTEFVLPEIPDLNVTSYVDQGTFSQMLYGDYLITTSLIAPNSLSNRSVRGGDLPNGRVAFAYDSDMRYSSDIYVNHFEKEYNTARVYGDIYKSVPQRYVNWQDPFDPMVINEDSITFDPAILLWSPEYPMSAQSENIDLKTYLRTWYEPCYEFSKAKKPAVVAETTYLIIDNQYKMPFHGASNNTWFAFPIAEDETTTQIGLELFENKEGESATALVKLTLVEGNTEPYGKNLSGKIRVEKKYYIEGMLNETVQFLDHKVRFIGTEENGTVAVVQVGYAGNKEDDGAIFVNLNQNATYYFDRYNTMYTTPQHPERTWYIRYEYKTQDGKAVIDVGKELQWGDVFYVDSVRYEVVAIEVIDDTGDGEQYFRMPPLPKVIYKDYNPSAPW